MEEKDLFYTVTEFAKLLKVSRQTVHNWIENKTINVVRVNNIIRIPKKEIEKLGVK